MAWEAIMGAILVAFGIFVLFSLGNPQLSLKHFVGPKGMYLSLLIGLAAFLGGGWLILKTIPIEVLKMKLVGLVLFGFGFFLLFHFPGITGFSVFMRHQPISMSRTGMLLGLILFIIGLYLLIFY